MLAFDCSNYTGEISFEDAHFAYNAGYRRAIVQIIDPPPGYPKSVWRQQIPMLLTVGFEVEAYVYLYLRDNPVARVQWVVDQMGWLRNKVQRLWLDVEDEGDNDSTISLSDRQSRLWECLELVKSRGFRTGIYTAGWWWDRYMPGVEWPRYYAPLWAAHYDGGQHLGIQPFGGWNNPEMKQFAGDSSIGNISAVDLNYYT